MFDKEIADKIIDVKKSKQKEPKEPYSSTKSSFEIKKVKKTNRSGSTSSTGSKNSKNKKSKNQQIKLNLNINGALMPMGGLPLEHYLVILKIFSHLSARDLCRICQVSKAWKVFIGESSILWEIKVKNKWPEMHPQSAPLLDMSWKLYYRSKITRFQKENFREGFGTFVWANGNKYVGNWLKNKREGLGRMTYSNKDIFEGIFKDGRKHGNGIYRFHNGTLYSGTWEKGRLHGSITIHYCNLDSFQGFYFRGERMGLGTLLFSKGPVSAYVGDWRRGRQEGNGKLILRNKSEIHSIWLNGNPITEINQAFF